MHKLYLCGITSAGKEQNLRELILPIRDYFNGLCWTFHTPLDDGATFLESQKGDGAIVYAKWCQRHGYSMTHYLWQGPMKSGDLFVQLDDMERLSVDFCRDRLPALIGQMRQHNLAMVSNYGKGLIFRYNEQLEFRGSPHWFATQLDGGAANVELSKEDFWNVRGENRDPFQFVTHYLKYYLYPAGSNHCLLGLEKNGDPKVLFPIREQRRLDFLRLVDSYGYAITVDGVKEMMADGLDIEMVKFFNEEKILNDAYRHLQLGHTDFPDDHDFKNMIKIEPS